MQDPAPERNRYPDTPYFPAGVFYAPNSRCPPAFLWSTCADGALTEEERDSLKFYDRVLMAHSALCLMASEALIDAYLDGLREGKIRFIPAPKRDGWDDASVRWWYDLTRPIMDGETLDENQPYYLVQTYSYQDPNTYVRVKPPLRLLFTDQCEYYAVCGDCHTAHSHQQWSGSTRGGDGWQEAAEMLRARHEATKGWCQFCDPVFGNGGWRAD